MVACFKYSRATEPEIVESVSERYDSKESENESSDLVSTSGETQSQQTDTEESDSNNDPDVKSINIGFDYADALCAKLNDLIRGDVAVKNQFHYNECHPYDPDVIEFFKTLSYLTRQKLTGQKTYRTKPYGTKNCEYNLWSHVH